MSYDLNCLFCKIVVGEILSMKVYEDDEFVVFCDICLVVDMYVFVILCQYLLMLLVVSDVDVLMFGWLMLFVVCLVDQFGVVYMGGEIGFCMVINMGLGGGQEVYYLYVYILVGLCLWQ